jgi:hypothetical protein
MSKTEVAPYETKYLIKPLVWKTDAGVGREVAETSWVLYSIVCRDHFSVYHNQQRLGQFGTLEEAKADAEDHYLLNMRNCLEEP